MKQLWQQMENHQSVHSPELLADPTPPVKRMIIGMSLLAITLVGVWGSRFSVLNMVSPRD